MKKAITPDKMKGSLPFSSAVLADQFLFISGQLPMDYGTKTIPEAIEEQTTLCMENIKAILKEENLDLSDVVRFGIFVTDMSQFSIINKIYASYLKEPYPARAAIGVVALPMGAKIEIEATVLKK